MTDQWRLIRTALSFYTRIPVGKLEAQKDDFGNSSRYFPFVGYVLGLWVCLIHFTVAPYLSSELLAIFIVATTLLMTGAIHEDGFADCCDGFGGGYEKSRVLAIMKDSRLGTFGTVGLIILLALKIQLIIELVQVKSFMIPLVSTYVLSRLFALPLAWRLPYAREDSGTTHSMMEGMTSKNNILIPCLTILPLFLVNPVWFLFLLIFVLVFMCFLAMNYLRKRIGGYTGDCLGALQQINEVIILLCYSLLF